MKSNFPLAILLLLCYFSYAQNRKIDSLKKTLSASVIDTNQLKSLNSLSWELILVGEYDSSMAVIGKGLAVVEKLLPATTGGHHNFVNRFKGSFYNNRASIYYLRGDFSKAMEDFKTTLVINREADYKVGIARAYNGIGICYAAMGNYPAALENYYACLKLQIELKDKTSAAACYNNIGLISFDQKNYDEALKNYLGGLEIQLEKKNKPGLALAYNNIGLVYEEKKQYEKALENLTAALRIYEELGQKRGLSGSYHNIAVVLFKQNDLEGALQYHAKNLKLLEETGDKKGLAGYYMDVGHIYLQMKLYDKALPNFEKARMLSEETGFVEFQKNSYSGLWQYYEARNDAENAHKYYKLYINRRDSLINEENTRKTLQAQMNFDFEQQTLKQKAEQEKKDALVEEELKRQKLLRWSTIGILSLLLLASMLLLNRIRLKQKNKLQEQLNAEQKERASAVMETQEQERKRIAEDLHDSLGHLLSTAKLNLQTIPGDQKLVQNSLSLLNQASEEIRNITFNLMPKTLEEGGLIPALNELASKVTNTGRVKVVLHVHDMEKFILEKNSQFNIYRIVQEAVNNILKHADAKEINIQLIGQKDHITIMIEDDGRGFNTQTNKEGRGLKNIVTRSLWLKGNINIDSRPGHGTTITTEIPV